MKEEYMKNIFICQYAGGVDVVFLPLRPFSCFAKGRLLLGEMPCIALCLVAFCKT